MILFVDRGCIIICDSVAQPRDQFSWFPHYRPNKKGEKKDKQTKIEGKQGLGPLHKHKKLWWYQTMPKISLLKNTTVLGQPTVQYNFLFPPVQESYMNSMTCMCKDKYQEMLWNCPPIADRNTQHTIYGNIYMLSASMTILYFGSDVIY